MDSSFEIGFSYLDIEVNSHGKVNLHFALA